MANPQCEDGYTKIANQLIDRLIATSLTGGEFKVCLFVIRKTYGYHKKMDAISITQFQKNCILSRQTVINCLDRLVKMNILVKVEDKITIYGIQKDYEQWVVDNTRLVKTNSAGSLLNLTSSSQNDSTDTSQNDCTHKRKKEIKRKYTKETKNKFLGELDNFKREYGKI